MSFIELEKMEKFFQKECKSSRTEIHVIDLKINDELNSLVSGKDVSIIGPAPYLIGKDRGSEI